MFMKQAAKRGNEWVYIFQKESDAMRISRQCSYLGVCIVRGFWNAFQVVFNLFGNKKKED